MAESGGDAWNAPVSAKAPSGGKRRERGGEPKVTVRMVWEGTALEARAFSRLQKQLIADLEGTADRGLALKWRRVWAAGCEEAGVADA